MGEYLWQGCDILHDGMVLKAVNRVSRFATKVGDFFVETNWISNSGFMGAGGPSGAFMDPRNTTLVSTQSMDGL